jgi:hypothetical protein
MTTLREWLMGWGGADETDAAIFCREALDGIDPDLDPDRHRLVAVPKCETCEGDAHVCPHGISGCDCDEWEECPTCRGTGDAGVPVVLPAEIAEHLPALLWLAQGCKGDPSLWLPDTTWRALDAWLEAQP